MKRSSVGASCIVFIPEKAPEAKMAQLLVFGAQVLAVRGAYDDAYDLCEQVCEEKGWYNRNTGYNPFTREGKKTCSFEVCEQLGWRVPDRIVVPVGDENIISGIWKGLKDLYAVGLIDRLPKVDCAQATGSSAITQAIDLFRKKQGEPLSGGWRKIRIEPVQATTLADSISVDIPRDGLAAMRAVIEAVSVSDEELLTTIPELAQRAGIFSEPSSAATYAALKKMVEEKKVDPEERIVCLITGNGLKDIASARKAANQPIVIDPEPMAVYEAIHMES